MMTTPRRDSILRFYGLVLGMSLGLAMLCFGVIMIGHLTDTDFSCLIARDNRAPIFVDASRGVFFERTDSNSDPIDYIVPSPDGRSLAYGKRFTDADGQTRATVYVRHWTGVAFGRPIPVLENMQLLKADTFIFIDWSPDNQSLLTTWDSEDSSQQTVVIDSEGKRHFSPQGMGRLSAWGWTGDGAYYGFVANDEIILWSRDRHQFINTAIAATYLTASPVGHHFAAISSTQDGKFSLILYTPGDEIQHKFPLSDNFLSLQPDLYWSPDGQHLVITTLTPRGVGEAFSWMNLDDYNVDGTQIAHLDESVNAEINQSASMGSTLVWSPDNRRIVYIRQNQSTFSLWAYDLSLGRSKVLTDDIGNDFQMLDNTFFIAWRGTHHALFNVMTDRWVDLPENITDEGIAQVSPDGRVLAMTHQFTIRLVNLETSRILDYAPDDSQFDHQFAWSPDSKQVAISYRTNNGYILDIVRADGVLLRRLKVPKSLLSQQLSAGKPELLKLQWSRCRG